MLPINFQTVTELQTKIQSRMHTCIWKGIETGRLSDALNSRLFADLHGLSKAGIFIAIDTTHQCTFAGTGPIFENFKRTGKLENYTGFGMTPTTFYEPDFDVAKVRYINFDETYAGMPYDCTDSKSIWRNKT